MEYDNEYISLAVMDRVSDEILRQGMNYSQFSKKLGFTAPYFSSRYHSGQSPTTKSLYMYAEALNISVEYLLTGKGDKTFKPFDVNLKTLIEVYDKVKRKYGKVPNKLSSNIFYIKHKKHQDVNIRTLFNYADFLKTPAVKLMGG